MEMEIDLVSNENENNEKICLLLGPTGSGKSTFIEYYFNIKGLSSTDTDSYTYCPIIIKHQNINIIDTPGIFDSHKSDQEIYDQIHSICKKFGYIDHILLFNKYSGRIDSNIQDIIEKYTIFLGKIEKSINIVFTGFIPEDEKTKVKKYDFYKFKSIKTIYFWDKRIINEYSVIERDLNIVLNGSNFPIIQSKNMKEVYTLETQKKKLERDLKLLKKEKDIDIKIIDDVSLLINDNTKLKYTTDVDDFQCPGIIKINNKILNKKDNRCTNSRKGCLFLKNYYLGKKPKHQKINDWSNVIIENNINKIVIKPPVTPMTPQYINDYILNEPPTIKVKKR